MSEQEIASQTECEEIGVVEKDGQVLARDMKIVRGGRTYTIGVADNSYLDYLRTLNEEIANPDGRYDDQLLPLPDISDPDKICNELARIADRTLQPFVTEQLPPSPEE